MSVATSTERKFVRRNQVLEKLRRHRGGVDHFIFVAPKSDGTPLFGMHTCLTVNQKHTELYRSVCRCFVLDIYNRTWFLFENKTRRHFFFTIFADFTDYNATVFSTGYVLIFFVKIVVVVAHLPFDNEHR